MLTTLFIKNSSAVTNIQKLYHTFTLYFRVFLTQAVNNLKTFGKNLFISPIKTLWGFLFKRNVRLKDTKTDIYDLKLCVHCGHHFNVVASMPHEKIICPSCQIKWMRL